MMQIIGHRGSHSPDGPLENTLEAFERAMAEGADMVELDVWLAADGVLVIHHDEALPGAAAPLTMMTSGAVEAASAARGVPVPRLASALELMRRRVPVVVEIKHGGALSATLRLIRDLAMQNEVILSSFDLSAIEAAAELAPGIARALIMGTETLRPNVRFREAFPFWALRRADAAYWHPAAILLGAPLVAALGRLGVRVNAWTVNDSETARRLAAWGVAGLITDCPGCLRQAFPDEGRLSAVAGAAPRRPA